MFNRVDLIQKFSNDLSYSYTNVSNVPYSLGCATSIRTSRSLIIDSNS